MRKIWLALLGGAAIGGVVMVVRRRGDGYEDDDIDAAGQGATFGQRAGDAPEQKWAPAETRTDVTPEQLSMASRIGASADAIRSAWPAMTPDEIEGAEGDLDRLAGAIAQKSEQPVAEVRRRVEEIIARETPNPSYPAH